VYRQAAFFAILGVLLAGCDLRTSLPGSSTSTPFIITATLAPTTIPSATLTPIPATPTATVTPIQGTTSTQVNVRGQPSTAAPSLSILPPLSKVQIVGQDVDGAWYQILYPQGPDGRGWVTAQYVVVPQGKDKIPIVGSTGTGATPGTGTPGAAASGTVIQQVNVRKGPGTDFDAIGTLNPPDVVTLTGKDPSGSWLQIRYAGAPDGIGWVAASYIQATGDENLPIIGSNDNLIGTATATTAPLIMTPTPAAALDDHDSPASPAVNVTFSAAGTRTLIYSSDISSPRGDSQDWIEFTPYGTIVLFTLSCTGNRAPALALLESGSPVAGWVPPACGESRPAQVESGKPYLIEVSLAGNNASQVYVRYTLRIESTS
jgi:uncharacterized protein YraI